MLPQLLLGLGLFGLVVCLILFLFGSAELANPNLFKRPDAQTPEMLDELAKLGKPMAQVTHREFWQSFDAAKRRIQQQAGVEARQRADEAIEAMRAQKAAEAEAARIAAFDPEALANSIFETPAPVGVQ